MVSLGTIAHGYQLILISVSCRGDRVACDGVSPEPCSACLHNRRPCTYSTSSRSPSPASELRSTRARSSSRIVSPAIRTTPGRSSTQLNGAIDDPSINIDVFSSQPTVPHDPATSLPLPATDREVFDWFSLLNTRPSSEQRFESILPEFEPNLFEVLNSNAPNTPAWDFWGALEEPLRGLSGEGLDQSPEFLHGTPTEIRDGQPYNSYWVSTGSRGSTDPCSHTWTNLVHPK